MTEVFPVHRPKKRLQNLIRSEDIQIRKALPRLKGRRRTRWR